jgi:ribose/xylose/arabinose/galactoside ABC-type transport system permease subunit
MKRGDTWLGRGGAILREYGFIIILLAVIVFFSVATKRFFSLTNILGLLHASAPLAMTAAGLAMVVMTGKLDISIGSVSFFSSAVGAILMTRMGVSPALALPAVVAIAALCGLANGLVCVYLGVNPLITTMGSMFIFRGLALQLTGSRVISIPGPLRAFGNLRLGPVFLDALIALGFLLLVHLLHTRSPSGRRVMALGNGAETAARLGVRVDSVSLGTFVLSGLCAGIGGLFSVFQIGAVTLQMGMGLEFTAIAAIVIGGISLFGGEGAIFPNYILGILTLGIIENGLNHLGASPYVYPFVRGGIILVAMYADSLKRNTKPIAILSRT